MKVVAAIPVARRCALPLIFLIFLLLAAAVPSHSQRKYPGRGAVSAQDCARLSAPMAAGSDAADQVCAVPDHHECSHHYSVKGFCPISRERDQEKRSC